jgi:hypothetical protein
VDVFNAVLPVVTLLIGAWLTSANKRSEVRNTMRLEAADLLAELPIVAWTKGGEGDLLNLEKALSRLGARLSLAGMPAEMIAEMSDRSKAFWHGVYETEHRADPWAVDVDLGDFFTTMTAYVGDWLGTNSRIRRVLIERDFHEQRVGWQARSADVSEPSA